MGLIQPSRCIPRINAFCNEQPSSRLADETRNGIGRGRPAIVQVLAAHPRALILQHDAGPILGRIIDQSGEPFKNSRVDLRVQLSLRQAGRSHQQYRGQPGQDGWGEWLAQGETSRRGSDRERMRLFQECRKENANAAPLPIASTTVLVIVTHKL
jgi:hypothetical protein